MMARFISKWEPWDCLPCSGRSPLFCLLTISRMSTRLTEYYSRCQGGQTPPSCTSVLPALSSTIRVVKYRSLLRCHLRFLSPSHEIVASHLRRTLPLTGNIRPTGRTCCSPVADTLSSSNTVLICWLSSHTNRTLVPPSQLISPVPPRCQNSVAHYCNVHLNRRFPHTRALLQSTCMQPYAENCDVVVPNTKQTRRKRRCVAYFTSAFRPRIGTNVTRPGETTRFLRFRVAFPCI